MNKKKYCVVVFIMLSMPFLSVVAVANHPPETHGVPQGEIKGIVGEEYTYTANATDQDDNDIKYGWDWDGDFTTDDWTQFVPNGTKGNYSHVWTIRGNYDIRFKAQDIFSATSEWSEPLTIKIAILADINDDGFVTSDDTNPFTYALNGETAFYELYPANYNWFAADCDRDGDVDFLDISLFNQLVNDPPEQPNCPSGETDGEMGEQYIYETNVTDPDNDQVYYKWDWGDGTYSGWLGPYSSGEAANAACIWNSAGSYNVKVKAKDTSDYESIWSEELTVNIKEALPEPKLIINVDPAETIEGDLFSVTVTREDTGDPVNGADVTFNGQTKQTDSNGVYVFSSTESGIFSITASKTGYKNADKKWITVKSEPVSGQPDEGWIWGILYDESYSTIENVEVCARLSVQDQLVSTYCQLTDENGVYILTVTPGSYTVEASRSGYESITETITLVNGEVVQLDFVLTKKESNPSTDISEELVESTIQSAIDTGYVAAKLTFLNSEDKLNPEIKYYSDTYKVGILQSLSDSDIIKYSVSADDAPGTFFITYMGKEFVEQSEENLRVTIDGIEMTKMSLEEFLHPEEIQESKYFTLGTKEGIYVGAYVSHFSEHTITISSVVEMIGGTTAILLYATFSILILVVATAHMKYSWRK